MGKIKYKALRQQLGEYKFHIRRQDSIWLDRVEKTLHPCPFCGEEAEIYTKYLSEHDGFTCKPVWIAGCHSCQVFQGAHNIHEMVRLWNHRVTWSDPDTEPWEVVIVKGEPVTMRMCPFCGKSPRLKPTVKYRDPECRDEVPFWRIECPRCEVDQEAAPLEMAKKCWNRRMDAKDYPEWNAGRVHLVEDWMWNWPDMEIPKYPLERVEQP